MRWLRVSRGVFLVVCSLAFLGTSISADWPHWRGENRNGVIAGDSGYEEGKEWLPIKADWSFEAGEGSTSPLVVGDQVFVMGWKDSAEWLHALDLATGKKKWGQSYPAPKHGRFAAGDQRRYGGTTATPEFDPTTGLLFTLGCDGALRAWDPSNSGTLIWQKNLYDEYAVEQRPKIGGGLRDYGYTSSPLIVENQLIVEVGAKSGTLIAFDPKTGKELWTSEYNRPAGHTGGPVPITIDEVPCVACLALYDLIVVRVDKGNEGKTLATHAWESDWANNILTPAVLGNEVLISSYHTHRAIRKVRVAKGKAEKVWEELFASHVGSPVVAGGKIYFAGRRLYCLDWDTGEMEWEGGMFGDGASLVYTADDRLLAYGGDCSLVLVDGFPNSPEDYRELSKISGATSGGPGDAWCHVTVAGDWVLCKNRMGQVTARR
ncbi:MAG: PQQ-binding-like beta-propeller repeat protein [Verrucomicrobiales bacterium]|nr:PQQ-binding-like beta-propeller repeat protein [Verrucomicrobiales bacterium]